MLMGFSPQPSRGKNAFCSLQSQGNEGRGGPEGPRDAPAAGRRALDATAQQARLPGGPELPGRSWPSQLSGFFRIRLQGGKARPPTGSFALCILKELGI